MPHSHVGLSEGCMATWVSRYVRKSLSLDAITLRRAQKALGVATASAAVRTSLARTVEMDRFWRLMARSHGRLQLGGIDRP